jgi:Rps23 Pro-64 3,4-dihydroxylase Tpa1-like proline 4-hydroxylase
VSLDEWRAADDRQRFYHFLELDGPPLGRPIAGGWLSWLLMRHRLESPEFLALVSEASGVKSGGLQSLKAHVMRSGHYLRPHSDRDGARRLCGALYLGDGWTAGYGGEFELLAGDDTVLSVEPRHNRLVLFDPIRHERHAVRVVTAEAGAWQRNSVSLWWGGEGL